jgi:hypothetical protein
MFKKRPNSGEYCGVMRFAQSTLSLSLSLSLTVGYQGPGMQVGLHLWGEASLYMHGRYVWLAAGSTSARHHRPKASCIFTPSMAMTGQSGSRCASQCVLQLWMNTPFPSRLCVPECRRSDRNECWYLCVCVCVCVCVWWWWWCVVVVVVYGGGSGGDSESENTTARMRYAHQSQEARSLVQAA